jgi:hypothetical protein
MSNDTKIEQFRKQVFDNTNFSTIESNNNIVNYVLKITNIEITKNDEHPDSICHYDTHYDGGHWDSHSDSHPDCAKNNLLGENEE